MAVSVRAAALSNYVAVARQVGLDPLAALRQFGLDPRVLSEPDLRVSAAAVAALLEYSAEASNCMTFGLRMAESRRLSDFGAVSLVLTHERSLRDVLAAMSRYRTFLNEALVIRIEDCGDTVVVREDLFIDGVGHARQAYELALGTLYRICCAVLGARWRPISVHFSHPAPESLDIHRRVFEAPCVFDSEFNGMLCSASDLDRQSPTSDPVMARYAEQFMHSLPNVGAASTSQEVARAIQMLLPKQRASIAGVADSLGVNVRTLQRRLEAEGVVFGELLSQVRRGLAERYLTVPSASLTDVAARLGYSQLSSFTRWFTAEFGMSPSAWRGRVPAEGVSRPSSEP
jgi:AraC-like DNA-binding protein